MDSFDAFEYVIAVVEHGSITAAADKLNKSKSVISKCIKEIEHKHNIRLFNRNSKRLTLTDVGEKYYEHAKRLKNQYVGMLDEVTREQTSAQGRLRVSSPIAFGEHVLAALLPEFCELYPDIKIELLLGNHSVDMLKDNIDIRIKSGRVEDSNMIAKRLCDWPMAICAAPDYLGRFGEPKNPEALVNHSCVLDSNMQLGQNWPFVSDSGEHKTILINSNISSNNPQAVVNLIKAGAGIGFVALQSIKQELERGELVLLLKEYQARVLDIFLIYPHKSHLPQKHRAFIDFICSNLGQ
jgi:DNA-binding transcriptional LysR family regulator